MAFFLPCYFYGLYLEKITPIKWKEFFVGDVGMTDKDKDSAENHEAGPVETSNPGVESSSIPLLPLRDVVVFPNMVLCRHYGEYFANA